MGAKGQDGEVASQERLHVSLGSLTFNVVTALPLISGKGLTSLCHQICLPLSIGDMWAPSKATFLVLSWFSDGNATISHKDRLRSKLQSHSPIIMNLSAIKENSRQFLIGCNFLSENCGYAWRQQATNSPTYFIFF